jgi:hypothetical protein
MVKVQLDTKHFYAKDLSYDEAWQDTNLIEMAKKFIIVTKFCKFAMITFEERITVKT